MNLPDDFQRAPWPMSCTRTGSRCRLWLSRRASETTMQALTFPGGAKKAPGWSLSANFLVAHQHPNYHDKHLKNIDLSRKIYNSNSHFDSLFHLMLLDFSGQL